MRIEAKEITGNFRNRIRGFGYNQDSNYERPYTLSGENILDCILTFGTGGVTHQKISESTGYKGTIIRSRLAKLINRSNCKNYVTRKKFGGFVYYPVFNYNPKIAYSEIMRSSKQKETLNQIGLRDSIYELPYNYELFPNVFLRLKKSKTEWKSVCELSIELGVNHPRGKKTIYGELQRDLKCKVEFVEKKTFEDGIVKYRLKYKYRRHTYEEIREIAKTFPRPEDSGEIRSVKTQVLNGLLE